jgi:hypothetical protein
MDSRRDVLKKMLFGAAATALPLKVAMAQGFTNGSDAIDPEALEKALSEQPLARQWMARMASTETAPAPWDLIAPLQAGVEIALGWSIESLSEVTLGAAILTLKHTQGHTAHVHISSHAGNPIGMANTRHFDIVLMNGADGNAPSAEPIGRVVLTIADLIRRNENQNTQLRRVADDMLSHEDRTRLFGPEALLA